MVTEDQLNQTVNNIVLEYTDKPLLVLPSSINDGHGQCFDVAAKFADMIGIPHVPGNPSAFPYVHAYQIYTNYSAFQAQYFDRIPNTLTFIPKKGDLVVWPAELNGGDGHVALAIGEGNMAWFRSFDENWDFNNWHCRTITHGYGLGSKTILGVLRLRVAQTPMDQRAYLFDVLWQGLNGPVDTTKVTKAQVDEKVAWIKSNVNRAGFWDRICTLAGYTGDTNNTTPENIKSLLQKPNNQLLQIKQKLLEIANGI